MKVRTAFVSNSSSTSFCIYGICIEENLIPSSKFQAFHDQDQKYEFVADIGLDLIYSGDDTSTYIGRHWCNIQDDETGKEFKQSVVKRLAKLGIKEEPETHCDTIYS
jgi:hypothetical protein